MVTGIVHSVDVINQTMNGLWQDPKSLIQRRRGKAGFKVVDVAEIAFHRKLFVNRCAGLNSVHSLVSQLCTADLRSPEITRVWVNFNLVPTGKKVRPGNHREWGNDIGRGPTRTVVTVRRISRHVGNGRS